MDLVSRLKSIAKIEGIAESELILEEAESFLEEHKDHGGYTIEQNYSIDGKLKGIYLTCRADDNLVDPKVCSHYDPNGLAELSFSIIYQEHKTSEVKLQELKRKGYDLSNLDVEEVNLCEGI